MQTPRPAAATLCRDAGRDAPHAALAGLMATLAAGALIWAMAALGAHAQDTGTAGAGAAGQDVTTSYGISTFGNLKYPADFKHLDYVNPDAPKGGEISEAALGSFDSMNPYTIKGQAGALSSIFYESLMTNTADEKGASYCLICKTLEYPKDRSWVIFNLRPDVRFSNGKPLTAEDVDFSYHLLLTKGLPDFRLILSQQVDKVQVLGPLKIKFTFKKGWPTRDLPQMVGGLPIFSKADYIANKRDFAASSFKPFVGSGPYVLDSLKPGQTIVYKRNPDYWGRNLPINKGRWNFDRIRIEYYGDSNAAFEGFKGGTYTFRNENSSKQWATAYDFPGVQKGYIKKVALPNGNIAPGQSFVFNLRRHKFDDIRVREAIALMFNFNWSNKTLFYDQYARINSFWENSDLEAKGKPSAGELAILKPLAGELPAGILTDDAVMAPTSGPRQLDRHNLRKASHLLDEAGWKVGADGMRRNAEGKELHIEFLNDQQAFSRIIQPYVENLRRLGIDAYQTQVDSAQYTTRTRNPDYDFDIITAMFPMSYVPGSGLKQYFGSATADVSTFNVMGLKNKAIDSLIDTVLAAQSQAQLKTSVHALDRALRSLHFWVPEWYKNKYTVAYYDMYDHPKTMPPYDLGELDFWWYDAKKAAALKAAGALQQ